MDADSSSSSSYFPQPQKIPRPTCCVYSDRFIPVRSATDFDLACCLLVAGWKEKENNEPTSLANYEYREQLAKLLMPKGSRILAFKSNPIQKMAQNASQDCEVNMSTSYRHIRRFPERILDAQDIVNDFYLNLLDWSISNIVAIDLRNRVFLWRDSDKSVCEFLDVGEEGSVSSVSWSPNGRQIAVGMNYSYVELWDITANQKLRALQHGMFSRVSSLSWKGNILTTGGNDGMIFSYDFRMQSPKIQSYEGHDMEVCGLKWSTGYQLASGGNDNLLHIWDQRMSATNSPKKWLHRLEAHEAAIKALSWCPYQGNLLASGGGDGDGCIKFWDSGTGTLLNSVNTGSQVTSLLWSTRNRELLSSHGLMKDQLILWKYPEMAKIEKLDGHLARVLCMAQSPDGCTVASAGADEWLSIWNVFGTPGTEKRHAKSIETGPSFHLTHLR